MNTPLKQCSQKEHCIHPEKEIGGWLPSTADYFYIDTDKKQRTYMRSRCRKCENARSNKWKDAHRQETVAYSREYYAAHKEQASAWHREYHALHRDKMHEKAREYREANREEHLARSRRWREQNPDKVSAYRVRYHNEHREERHVKFKSWRETNLDYARECNRHWSRANPERNRASRNRRRARLVAGGGNHTHEDVLLLLRTQKNKCWWCGISIDGSKYHVDHRIPLAKGGGNNAENLCIACPPCNLSKHDKLPFEFNGRLL